MMDEAFFKLPVAWTNSFVQQVSGLATASAAVALRHCSTPVALGALLPVPA